LPSREADYAKELRAALDAAGVELFSLLIDDGDITHPQYGERDLAWISRWIETAGALGATATRVIAGKAAPSEEALKRSITGLTTLVDVGKANGVRVMTENWFSLLSTPENVRRILSLVDVGLCCDFGNWGGENKYEDLAEIMPFAESCHAKCAFTEAGEPDREDYLRCLELAKTAVFNGPYTLIYDSPNNDNEWEGLAIEKAMVEPYLSNN
jgi:sugar phosphate isomerase/epimerase